MLLYLFRAFNMIEFDLFMIQNKKSKINLNACIEKVDRINGFQFKSYRFYLSINYGFWFYFLTKIFIFFKLVWEI